MTDSQINAAATAYADDVLSRITDDDTPDNPFVRPALIACFKDAVTWAQENSRPASFMDEALNSGDGVYRP